MKCYQIRNRSNSLRYTAEINLALFIIDHEARDVDGNLFKKNCEQETEPRNVTFYLHCKFYKPKPVLKLSGNHTLADKF